MTAHTALSEIFDADRAARAAERRLLELPPAPLTDALEEAVAAALALEEGEESELRLCRLADLCAQVAGPRMADALLTILDHPSPGVRTEAGETLLDLAYARFKEVAMAVERALDRGDDGPAMQELPFVLTEVRDPDPVPLVARFLSHPKAEVVAAAIEALAAYGDPAAVKYLEPLLEDEREAILEDLDEPSAKIGELAEAALEELWTEP